MGIMIHDSLDCVKGLRRKGLQPPSRFDKDLPGDKARSGRQEFVVVFVREAFHEALIREAVIGVVPDDDVVENLNGEKLRGPHELSCELPIFRRGCGIAGRVVVHEYEGGRTLFKGKRHNVARIDRTSGQSAQENILIENQLIFAI